MNEFYAWLSEEENNNGRCVNPTNNAKKAWDHQQKKIETLKQRIKIAYMKGDWDKFHALLTPETS